MHAGMMMIANESVSLRDGDYILDATTPYIALRAKDIRFSRACYTPRISYARHEDAWYSRQVRNIK